MCLSTFRAAPLSVDYLPVRACNAAVKYSVPTYFSHTDGDGYVAPQYSVNLLKIPFNNTSGRISKKVQNFRGNKYDRPVTWSFEYNCISSLLRFLKTYEFIVTNHT